VGEIWKNGRFGTEKIPSVFIPNDILGPSWFRRNMGSSISLSEIENWAVYILNNPVVPE
jgi:hypothetical protein